MWKGWRKGERKRRRKEDGIEGIEDLKERGTGISRIAILLLESSLLIQFSFRKTVFVLLLVIA